MSEVYEIADRYVLAYAALDPIAATDAGIAGHDHELTDFSPDGAATRATGSTATRSPRSRDAPRDRRPRPHRGRRDDRTARARDRVARRGRGAARRCGSSGARCRRSAAASTSWPTTPTTTGRSSRERLARVPDVDREPRGRRCAKACSAGSSPRGARRSGARSRPRRGAARRRHHAVLRRARRRPRRRRQAARRARAQRGRPRPRPTRSSRASSATSTRRKADPRDPVGRERYALFARAFNGIDLDLDETYAWGWEELYRIEDAMRRVARAHPARRVGRRGRSTTSTTT